MDKIVMLSTYWLPHKGGPPITVANIVKQIKNKYKMYVVTYDPNTQKDTFVHFVSGKGVLLVFDTIVKLFGLKPDIIHCHSDIKLLFSAYLYCKIFRKTKLMHTFHTQPHIKTYLSDVKHNSVRPKSLKMRIAGHLFSQCDCLTSVSQNLVENKRKYQGLLRREKVTIVPSGASFKRTNDVKNNVFLDDNKIKGKFPIIASIGVFTWDWKVKGLITLIKAVKKLAKEYPGIRLIIVGDGEYRKKLINTVAELNLDEYVIFTGYVQETETILSICDIYCHLAENEGLSLAVLEALAAGRIVIAADSGGMPEAIEDGRNGFLIEPSIEETIKRIRYCINSPKQMIDIKNNAKATILDRYTWEQVVSEYDKIYMKMLRNK